MVPVGVAARGVLHRAEVGVDPLAGALVAGSAEVVAPLKY